MHYSGLSESRECARNSAGRVGYLKNHPFKVFRDDKMEEMIESISEYGVLVPGNCKTFKFRGKKGL